MPVETRTLSLETRGRDHIVDLTDDVAAAVRRSGLESGVVTVFVPGSTGGITTIEYEPGLVEDMHEAVERLFPKDLGYQHNALNHDDNGHSHVRAAFIGPSLSVPFEETRLTLGTWQQIVFIDFDSHARQRRIIVQVMGE